MKKHAMYDIWNQVPVKYYQDGVKKNLFQKIWHGKKIGLAKKVIRDLKFVNCLDVGCSSGHMISEIAEAFPNVKYFGVDIYDKAIRFAKQTYPWINFKIASSDNLPFGDNSFDLIICYETLEHMENPVLSLKEIKRVLKGNGILILAMDSGSLLFRLVWFIWENTRGKVWRRSHLHPFHHNQLDAIIEQSGFMTQRKFFSHFGMEVTYVLKK